MRQLIATAAAIGAGAWLAVVAGCQWLGLSCTQVGCVDGATLTVYDADGGALDRFHGVVRLENDAEVPFSCEGEDGGGGSEDSYIVISCLGNEVSFDSYSVPVGVTIESDVADERREVDLLLHLEEDAPNGKACGPVCLYAEVDVRLER